VVCQVQITDRLRGFPRRSSHPDSRTMSEANREQFSKVERPSALGELAGAAHDFNNTLAAILGRAQLLLRTDDPEKIKHGLNLIIKTAEDGAKTVKRIRDFSFTSPEQRV